MFMSKNRKRSRSSMTGMLDKDMGNKGGSGSHKTNKKKKGSFSLKSMRQRRVTNAQATGMHGDIMNVVDGFTDVERRMLRYLVLRIARQLLAVAVTELKEIDFNVTFKVPLHQVLSKTQTTITCIHITSHTQFS